MRVWINGELCYDQEPIQAHIMDLEKKLATCQKELKSCRETLIYQQNRIASMEIELAEARKELDRRRNIP